MTDLQTTASSASSLPVDSMHVSMVGDQPRIAFSAEHLNDAESAGQLSDHVAHWIESQEFAEETYLEAEAGENDVLPTSVTVDLAEVAWVSSVGLNELIGMNRSARKHGVELVLANVQTAVKEVLVLTRLERIFNVDWKEASICEV